MKRSWKSMLVSCILVLIFSALAIVLQYLIIAMDRPEVVIRDFNSFADNPNHIFFIDDHTLPIQSTLDHTIAAIFASDTHRTIENLTFSEAADLNSFLFTHQQQFSYPVAMCVGFSDLDSRWFMSIHFNTSSWVEQSTEFTSELMGTRALWRYVFNGDFIVSFTRLTRHVTDMTFGRIGPIIMGCGLLSIIPMIMTQPIVDMNGEVRSYMETCTLTIFPYWIATFSIDIVLWVIVTTGIWAIFCASQIGAFLDNLFSTWYIIVFCGPGFILFNYCLSFVFDSVATGARICFLGFVVLLLIPFIVFSTRDWEDNPFWVDVLYSFVPHLCINQLYITILVNMGPFKRPFMYYWEQHKAARWYLIMQYGDAVLYGLVLYGIEKLRGGMEKRAAKRDFGNYNEFFEKTKGDHEILPEVQEMEAFVSESHDFAVRIENVSRLFFNSEGDPIPAVNSVSLGVKHGALFGFLGANGAGKTTLIKMITSMLPTSNGSIEINGIDIAVKYDSTAISVCPQFNRHLCYEMTIREHFKLYGMIFEMSEEETAARADYLIESLHLKEICDQEISSLSQGDVRKLAIALSFFGRANIVLLDEPTASLDPVARRDVQEMILATKGTKTFMLCTHLLSEAEFLCDVISIMVKGCLYTVGSPQMLTEKFGKDFKIDLMLADDSDACGEKCDRFFAERLPAASLSIQRPKARIYDVPAASIDLGELFEIMEEGIGGENGYVYYTCSSSSLERVFMEIVKMSEES